MDIKDSTRAELHLGAQAAPPESFWHLIVDNKDALVLDGFRVVAFSGREFPLDELTTLEELKQRIQREGDEAKRRAEAEEDARRKKYIFGTASEIGQEITLILKPRLPKNANLEFDETEESRSAGYLMHEHNEYRGKVVVNLSFADRTKPAVVLAKYYSGWSNQSSSGGGMYTDRSSHSYELDRVETTNGLLEALEGAKRG